MMINQRNLAVGASAFAGAVALVSLGLYVAVPAPSSDALGLDVRLAASGLALLGAGVAALGGALALVLRARVQPRWFIVLPALSSLLLLFAMLVMLGNVAAECQGPPTPSVDECWHPYWVLVPALMACLAVALAIWKVDREH